MATNKLYFRPASAREINLNARVFGRGLFAAFFAARRALADMGNTKFALSVDETDANEFVLLARFRNGACDTVHELFGDTVFSGGAISHDCACYLARLMSAASAIPSGKDKRTLKARVFFHADGMTSAREFLATVRALNASARAENARLDSDNLYYCGALERAATKAEDNARKQNKRAKDARAEMRANSVFSAPEAAITIRSAGKSLVELMEEADMESGDFQ